MSNEKLDLHHYLTERSIDAEVIGLDVDTRTVPAAAAALETDEEAIVKSLLFQGKSGDVVLVIAGGPARVDTKKVAEVSGITGLRLAKPSVVQEKTGYPVGGVPPVGHRQELPVLVDRQVMNRDVVYGGGGSPELLLRIRPDDIVALTGGRVAGVIET